MMPDIESPTLITMPIQPKSKADRERFAAALADLAATDGAFRFTSDIESGQTILHGISEIQLDEQVRTLRSAYEIDVEIGAPQIAYRETILRRVEKDYTYRMLTIGAAQFARVKMIVEPYSHGTIFEPKIVGGAVAEAFILAAAKGVDSVMGSGVLAGFPLIDVKVTLIDGAYHDVDSSVLTFETAARMAFRESLRDGGAVLMEPIMAVEITVPQDYIGSVTGDLSGRRGQVQSQTIRSDGVFIEATVPFANLFGYVNQLRSFTQGRGRHTMRFAFYRAVDAAIDPKTPFPPVSVALRVA